MTFIHIMYTAYYVTHFFLTPPHGWIVIIWFAERDIARIQATWLLMEYTSYGNLLITNPPFTTCLAPPSTISLCYPWLGLAASIQ
ncbi:hypothetical protein GDO81_014107 [Engystomops pustulosus]|uniref:Uncharacterized protein n=1 Tax=Engystomops pustulosus TaxID=76066 RepID=A0AAV7B857_ENGPU|nr:hypothetical protein GDO81_014107 [Engystomops pustulosus]